MLPYTPIRRMIQLPSKFGLAIANILKEILVKRLPQNMFTRSQANSKFYIYCIIWAVVSYAHAIGAIIGFATNDQSKPSTCLLEITKFIYFSLYGPFVYFVFLRGFFRLLLIITCKDT
jgi:hypothetical protein